MRTLRLRVEVTGHRHKELLRQRLGLRPKNFVLWRP